MQRFTQAAFRRCGASTSTSASSSSFGQQWLNFRRCFSSSSSANNNFSQFSRSQWSGRFSNASGQSTWWSSTKNFTGRRWSHKHTPTEDAVEHHPWAVPGFTGLFLWSAGDFAAQMLEVKGDINLLNYRRMLANGAFGFFFAGILGNKWYHLLHTFVKSLQLPRGIAYMITAKMGCEICIWHPLSLSVYWMWTGVTVEGKSLTHVWKELRHEFLPTLQLEVTLWTPVDILNFAFVPVAYQAIIVNFACFIEAIGLSYLHSHQDKIDDDDE